MKSDKIPKLVSVHGGHSGEFCTHARDTLEKVVQEYIKKRFSWVGITEHIPPVNDQYLYPEEIEEGLDADKMYPRFVQYIITCRTLQRKFASKIKIYVGFESEAYKGSKRFVKKLIKLFQPDYIVGSVHHVDAFMIDFSKEYYDNAAKALGGLDKLYCKYFDTQYKMLQRLKPAVVGHFDLIRDFDPDYRDRLQKPGIQKRVQRNLEFIKKNNLILDLSVRALYKGADEPYITRSILQQARDMEIVVVPGDDSHSVDSVGIHIDKGIRLLQEMGFDTNWKRPV